VLRRTKGPQQAEAALRDALKIHERLCEAFPAHPSPREGMAASHRHLGMVLTDLGRHADAEQAFRTALFLFEKLTAERPSVQFFRFGLARAHYDLGVLLRMRKRPQEAEAANCETSRLLQSLVLADPDVPEYRQILAGSLVNRAVCHRERGEWGEAHRLLEEALPHHRAAIGANPRASSYCASCVPTGSTSRRCVWGSSSTRGWRKPSGSSRRGRERPSRRSG
jgi:tetratricopeptide (TPR) repeat protein